MGDTSILFEAMYRGEPITVTLATDDEIARLEGQVTEPEDILDAWSLIAIHRATAVEVHALGWRVLLANTWITSPVVAVDGGRTRIRTRSGRQYALGTRDHPDLVPELRAHLDYALRTWGYDQVTPIGAHYE